MRGNPTTIWLDPPTIEKAQDLLIILQGMRNGAFVVESLPGAGHRGSLRAKPGPTTAAEPRDPNSLISGFRRRI